MHMPIITPTETTFDQVNSFLKMIDQDTNSLNGTLVSKTIKNLKTIKPTVMRYFEAPNQTSNYYSNGEYDLVSIFKLLDQEAYFSRATEKKLGLFFKSGQSIISDDDEITEYFAKRFFLMQMQTGISLHYILKQIAFYLLVCNNAWIVKVRSDECDFAHSYKKDGKELAPVVGLFLAHPTTMKPFFVYKKENGMMKAVLDKWVQTNKRGQIKYFPLDDVVHFTMNKQDGMLLGSPYIIPVMDDIRTLRKIEEDIELLMYRDLFPIIHYNVEKPQVLDHVSGLTELEQARNDMQKIVSDGGIATDSRHEIKFVGSDRKGIDATPYLQYFQQRVFTGLGVSPLDMSITGTGNVGDGETSSAAIIDTVKFLQQELSQQFEQHVLNEMVMQSPFSETINLNTLPRLQFEEIDIEWKIRKENHDADLFTKGVSTIHEIRNRRGDKTVSDEDLMYMHPSLYGEPAQKAVLDTQYGDKVVQHEGKIAHATTVPTTTTSSQAGTPKKTTHVKPLSSVKAGSTTQSAAKRDPIKSAGTNSNIVKKKARDFILTDSLKSSGLRDEFISSMLKLQDKNRAEKKINTSLVINYMYDSIKNNMLNKIHEGMEYAADDLGLEDYDTKIYHDIFSPLDKLRDEITKMVVDDPSYINKAANRIAITDRTEQARAENYGYTLVSLNNNHNKFTIYSDFNDIAQDSTEMLGKELNITFDNILATIPPFRPNSRLKIKIKEIDDNGKEE